MNNKIIALVSIGVAAVTFMSYNAQAGSAQGLTVTPTANDANEPITVRATSGALGSIERAQWLALCLFKAASDTRVAGEIELDQGIVVMQFARSE